MGSSMSSMAVQDVDSPYLCIFFREPDKIRIIHGPSLVDLVRNTIKNHGFKIQNELNYRGSHTFKLNGNPFSRILWGTSGSIAMRRMLCDLLSAVSSAGCTLVTSCNVSRENDISAWFFRREKVENINQHVICLSLTRSDSLALINGDNVSPLDGMIMRAIFSNYLPGLQNRKVEDDQTHVYKLYGNPWTSNGEERRHGIWLLLEIISQLLRSGYDYVGRVQFVEVADTLFFSRKNLRNEIGTIDQDHSRPFILSLEKKDRIRIFGASDSVITIVRGAIEQFYPKIIQNDQMMKDELGAWEFKLKGTPWWENGAENAIGSRYLILKVFETLYRTGWHVKLTMQTSKEIWDKSLFVMESCPPSPVNFICLSLNSTDIVRLINADINLADQVHHIISTNWPPGLTKERSRSRPMGSTEDVPEWKLAGYPWGNNATDGVFSRALLCALLEMFEKNEWFLVCSADVSAKYHSGKDKKRQYPLDVDAWYLAKQMGGSSIKDDGDYSA